MTGDGILYLIALLCAVFWFREHRRRVAAERDSDTIFEDLVEALGRELIYQRDRLELIERLRERRPTEVEVVFPPNYLGDPDKIDIRA
jgi:hypothetical protein